jgi:hypothetical protein
MTSAVLSPEFAVRDAALAQARAEVLAFAVRNGFVDRHLCGCGNPQCRNDSAETMPLLGLLRAVTTDWGAEPQPAGQGLLRSRLLMFARAFGLLECPCGNEDCPTLTADREDARGLVRIVADAWHGRAGNRVPPQGDGEAREHAAIELASWMRDAADRYAWNLGLLDALALRLDPSRAAGFRAVAGAMAASFGRPWPSEARAMAAEAAATWLTPPGQQQEVHRVLDAALAVAWHADWTTEDAALLEGAAADACMAILTSGIVHSTVTAALYAPFAEAVPLETLQDDLERSLRLGAVAA